MDSESPSPDPFATQESRRERSARRSRRRRRITIGALAAVVVLAGAGYGAYHLLSGDDSGGSATTSAQPSTTTAAPGTAGSTVTSPADGGSSGDTATSSTTRATAPNLAPQELTVTANAEDVTLTFTLQDGTSLAGSTPFSGQVPGGAVTVEFAKHGYNSLTRELMLDRPTELKVWLDPAGQLYQSVVRFKCGLNPYQTAFSPGGGELWVSFQGSGGLGIYDPETGNKLGAVRTGGNGTTDIVFTRDGNTAYVSQMETGSVYEIDRTTRAVKRRLPTEGTWTKALALSPDEKTLYAANWAGNDVSEIDLATGKLLRRIPTVATPSALYVAPEGRMLYVAGYEDGDIQRIDLSTATGTVIFETGGAMRDMVADEDLGLLYVDDASTDAVYVVDLLTDGVSKLAATDQHPQTLELSPDGKILYVANRGKDNAGSPYAAGPEWGTVLAFDTTTGALLDAIVGGNQCTGLDVSPDGTLVAFTDYLDHKVRVYSVPDYQTLMAGEGGRAEQRLDDMLKKD